MQSPLQQRNIDQARAHYDAALPLYRAERDRLGEASVYRRLADIFLAQEEWTQAKTYYERALPLFVAEREPIGQANALFGLGHIRFELGDHEQGMRDVQQAAAFYRSAWDMDGVRRAELYLAQMRIRLEHPEMDTELFDAFLNVKSAQEMLQLVQQHPRLLTDEWFTLVEALIASQEDEQNKEALRQRRDTLKQIRRTLEQEASESSESARLVVEFARADWAKRRQLLTEHADLLLNENIESAFDGLLEVNTDPGAIRILEEVRILLRRCRTWGVDPVWHLELHMRLGDGIEIPTEYEPVVMKAATLLSRQQEDNTALEQAIEAMQALLNRLTANVPPLFEAALLRDLADAMLNLPADHPARKLDEIEAYYREALPSYQAADRPLAVTYIQWSLGNVLNEQGRYDEALEALQAAIDGLRKSEENKSDLAWAISAYASTLDNLDQTEEALAVYTEAIELLPDTSPLLRNRAETLIHLRRLDEVEADLARAVELDGNEDSPYLWFRRAQIAIARGDSVLADQVLDEVLKRDPTHDVALQGAQSAWLRGELNAAQEALRQALAKANAGARAAMRRDMERLLKEHPDLPGASLLDIF